MSRTCTICVHAERAAIDTALVAGESVATISARYCTFDGRPLGRMAVQRHREGHLPATLAKAEAAKEAARADDLLREMKKLKDTAIGLLLVAERAGDIRTALAGVREARSCLQLLLEVEGEISRATNINVLVASPEWVATRGALLAALHPYPEARAAVVAELLKLEGGA